MSNKILTKKKKKNHYEQQNPSLIGQGLLIFLHFRNSLVLLSFVLLFTFSGALSLLHPVY
jgi:hypothetical protein